MIDLTDFRKYKLIYLIVILSAASLIAFLGDPLYHGVFIDVTVEPPENIRKTDFSWITVNEWFNTQISLIKSPSLLNDVKTNIGRDKLLDIVSAKRVGPSDIIRISISSNESIAELKETVSRIAELYLKQFTQPVEEAAKTIGKNSADIAGIKDIRNALYNKGEKIKKEIGLATERLKKEEVKLKPLEAAAAQLSNVKSRASQIENMLVSQKVEIVNLKSTYTDNWPAVSSLQRKIDALETEKQVLYREITPAQKAENAGLAIIAKIANEKQKIEKLRNRLKEINAESDKVKEITGVHSREGAAIKKEEPRRHIITPPTQVLYPKLMTRLLIAIVSGAVLWFLIGLLLNNIYLFWVLKARLFDKR